MRSYPEPDQMAQGKEAGNSKAPSCSCAVGSPKVQGPPLLPPHPMQAQPTTNLAGGHPCGAPWGPDGMV